MRRFVAPEYQIQGDACIEQVETQFYLSTAVQSWDTANKSGELNDYSVCTTWGTCARHDVRTATNPASFGELNQAPYATTATFPAP